VITGGSVPARCGVVFTVTSPNIAPRLHWGVSRNLTQKGHAQGISVSLSVRGVEEVQDALKKRARLASVGILETGLSSFEGMATECDQMIAEEGA
jgi:hypothetical protein